MNTTRELVVTYNSYAVSYANGRPVSGFYFQQKDENRGVIRFSFTIAGTDSAASFASACTAAETAFTTPFKDLTVAIGASNLFSGSQSGSTALDCRPTITKAGTQGADSARSRTYDVEIEFGLPASWNSSYPGLRDVNVTVGYTPARRREVTIAGTFTAITSTDALAQYEDQIESFVTATMTWLGVDTFELVTENPVTVSINRKTADFARLYREIVFGQLGSADDEEIVEQELFITRSLLGAENSPLNSAPGSTSQGSVLPLSNITATYSCWVDKDKTTDLRGKWDSIRGFVIKQIQDTLGGGVFALMNDAPTFNPDENRITSVISGIATDPDGSGTVQYLWEQETTDKLPPEFVPAWTGDPYSAFVYQAVGVRMRRTSTRKRTAGGGGSGAAGGAGSGASGGGGSLAGGAGGFFGWIAPGIIEVQNGNVIGYSSPISPGSGTFGLGVGGTLTYTGGYSVTNGQVNPDSGAGQFGIGGNGGGGGAGSADWFAVSQRSGTRPLQAGRPPYVITITETWSETVERYAKAISGSLS